MKTVQKIIDAHGGLVWLKEAGHHIKLQPCSKSMMPLVVEYIGDWLGEPGFPMVSVAHYYQQNGDMMRDPEMTFFLGTTTSPIKGVTPTWIPLSYLQDNMGICSEVFSLDNDGKVTGIRRKLLAKLETFSRQWDRDIHNHGYDKIAENIAA